MGADVMKMHTSQKCKFCGRFLYNADVDLPFEIKSTGAVIMTIKLDINCGHCHKANVYPVHMGSAETIRIDK